MRKERNRCSLLMKGMVVLITGCARPAVDAPSSALPPDSIIKKDENRDLVERLGHEDYHVREAATRALESTAQARR